MKIKLIYSMLLASTALSLNACSEQESAVSVDEMAAQDSVSAPSQADPASDASIATEAIPVSLPQLAYEYDFLFALPGEDLRKLQRQHASLCEQQGPASCQIAGMSTQGETGDEMTGELQLLVATQHARAFGALLEDEAESVGAEQRTANIATEEVSKQLVDTEARLASRIELRDRLREVLRTRRGTVQELIEAERGVAAVNEEIDQARAWLAETQGRVAMSRMTVHYESAAPVGRDVLGPVKAAMGSVGSIVGWVMAAMIIAGAVLVPVLGAAFGVKRLRRKFAGPAEARS